MTIGVDNVQQLDNVGVLHFFEKRDLADGGTGNTLIFGFQSDLLEGNNSVRMGQLAGLVDDTVRA